MKPGVNAVSKSETHYITKLSLPLKHAALPSDETKLQMSPLVVPDAGSESIQSRVTNAEQRMSNLKLLPRDPEPQQQQRDPTALPSPPVTDMTFIGGYTVEGHSIAASLRADGNVSSQASAFSVAQVRRWPALRCAAGPAAGPLTSVRAIRCRC